MKSRHMSTINLV